MQLRPNPCSRSDARQPNSDLGPVSGPRNHKPAEKHPTPPRSPTQPSLPGPSRTPPDRERPNPHAPTTHRSFQSIGDHEPSEAEPVSRLGACSSGPTHAHESDVRRPTSDLDRVVVVDNHNPVKNSRTRTHARPTASFQS